MVGIIVAQDRRPWGQTQSVWMIPTEVLAATWPPLSDMAFSALLLDPALHTHWDPRARGVDLAAEQGWVFTGRTNVLRELVEWLKDSGSPGADRRTRVVTAAPGSGKSAVLARLVTLSDRQYRRRRGFNPEGVDQSTMPPDGAIDIAVDAAGKNLRQIVHAIADGADVQADDPRQLVNELARRGPCTIVIDELSEAEQPRLVARDLLRLIAHHGPRAGIRLLVGTRRELLAALGGETIVIDLDQVPYIEPEDLARYVERILLAEDANRRSAYYGRADLARKIARAVAEEANPSFLIAQLVARDLVDQGAVVDTAAHRWREFPRTVDDAMERYLSRFEDRDERRVRRLLSALAWAEGQGLPSEIWLTIAKSLDPRTPDDAVEWLLERASGFLAEMTADGSPTFRLFHTALAEYLQRRETRSRSREWIQHQIASALLQTVPARGAGRDWRAAHRYVKAHLVTHAMAAAEYGEPNVLDKILVDPGFLLVADPQRLLRALPKAKAEPARQAAHAFTLADHHLRTKPRSEWSAYLEFAARRAGALELAERIEREHLVRPWSVRWIKGRTLQPHYVVGRHPDSVYAVALGMLEERPVVVSGGDEGQVRVWDLAGTEPVYEPLAGHSDSVYAVAVGTLSGCPIIVSGSRNRRIRFWDLATGQRIGDELEVGGIVHGLAIGLHEGRPVVVAGLGDNTVSVWDLDTRKQVWTAIGHGDEVRAVAVGVLDGRPIVVSGSRDRTVRIWDLATGRPIGEPVRDLTDSVNTVAIGGVGEQSVIVAGDENSTIAAWMVADIAAGNTPTPRTFMGHEDEVHAVAIEMLDGRPIVVSGSRDRTVRIWDLGTGRQVSQPLEQARPVQALATGTAEGRPVIAFGDDDRTVRVWNPPTGTPISDPLTGEDDAVNAVAVGTFADQPLLVSGGDDGTIRLWDLETGEPKGAFSGHSGAVNAVAVGTLDGRPVVASGGQDRTVRIWYPGADAVATWPRAEHTEHRDAVDAVAIGRLPDGDPVLVSGGDDDRIVVWSLRTCARVGGPLTDHLGPVKAVALATVHDEPVIVSGSNDGTVRIWDLVQGTPIGKPLHSRAHQVHTAAVGKLGDQPIVVAGGTHSRVDVWNLATMGRLEPLAGHDGPVKSLAVGTLDGRAVVATGEDNGTIRLRDLTDCRAPALAVKTGFGVRAIALGPASTIAVGGSKHLLVIKVSQLSGG